MNFTLEELEDLRGEIHNALRIIEWYEGCDYDKYCISEGEGNIRDCIEGLQYVESSLKRAIFEEKQAPIRPNL